MTPGIGIRQAMFERDKYIICEASEVIYRAGDPSNDDFLIRDRISPNFYKRGSSVETSWHE